MNNKKNVFITVPFKYAERHKTEMLNNRLKIAKEDYFKATGLTEDEVCFIDTITRVADDDVMRSMGVKQPRLQNLVTSIDVISDCDEIMLGANWHKSKFCVALSKIGIIYGIPMVWAYKNSKADKLRKNKDWYEKRNIKLIDEENDEENDE